MYNPHLSESPVSGLFPKGSTQLSFVLTRVVEGPTSGSGGSVSPYDCIHDWNWYYISLKDNICCWVTFSVIDSSNWSLIFCINCSMSSGAMDKDVWEVLGASPKYCLNMTSALATHTRPGCSGRPMVAVSTSWRPWAIKEPYEACSSNESCLEQIYWFTQSHNKHK